MSPEQQVASTIESFQSAALGEGSWMDALAALAAATGSRSGQLIGFGSDAALRFNWATELSDDCLQEFASLGWGDPGANPRVRAGMQLGELTSITEADFAPDAARLPFYADFSSRWDLPFSCISNLIKREGVLVGLAVIRTGRQGHIDASQQAVFAAVAPHVRHAVRTQMALQSRGGRTC